MSGETSSLARRQCLLTVPSHGRRGKGTFLDLFHKDTNPIHEGSALSCPDNFSAAQLLIPSPWGSGFNMGIFVGQKHSASVLNTFILTV